MRLFLYSLTLLLAATSLCSAESMHCPARERSQQGAALWNMGGGIIIRVEESSQSLKNLFKLGARFVTLGEKVEHINIEPSEAGVLIVESEGARRDLQGADTKDAIKLLLTALFDSNSKTLVVLDSRPPARLMFAKLGEPEICREPDGSELVGLIAYLKSQGVTLNYELLTAPTQDAILEGLGFR